MQLTKNIYEVKERLPTERVCKFDPNKRVIDSNILPMRKDRVITSLSLHWNLKWATPERSEGILDFVIRGLGGPKAMWSQLQRTS